MQCTLARIYLLYRRLHVSTKEVIGDESADDERQQIKAVKKKSHTMMVVYIQSKYQLTVTHLPSWNRKCGWIKKHSDPTLAYLSKS